MDDIIRVIYSLAVTPLTVAMQVGLGFKFWAGIISICITKIIISIKDVFHDREY